MKTSEKMQHWNTVFLTKDTSKVSWYQKVPETSLRMIEALNLPYSAKIMDAGCGDSVLPDFLLEMGFRNLTLADVSEKALEIVKNRLGEKAVTLEFRNTDITTFYANKTFDLWHDRAVFHFLTEKNEVQKYIETVKKCVSKKGYLILATFSENGPDNCSGLRVQKYSETKLESLFRDSFKKLSCFAEDHLTPSGGMQNFLFCLFQKL